MSIACVSSMSVPRTLPTADGLRTAPLSVSGRGVMRYSSPISVRETAACMAEELSSGDSAVRGTCQPAHTVSTIIPLVCFP